MIEYDYDVYGKVYVKNGTGYVSLENYTGNLYNNNILYTSREYDKEIGLYYYRARYYDANIGRFISRDPIGQVDNVNLYSYVGNNPVMYTDPMGKAKELLVDLFSYALSDVSGHENSDPVSKLLYWLDINTGKFDLAKTMDLLKSSSKFNESYFRNNNSEILVNGKRYNLGEVSNILVGFNANNIGYSEITLDIGGMGRNTVCGGKDCSNGAKGEYLDQQLYSAGYDYANKVNGNGSSIKTQDIVNLIENGTNARKEKENNLNSLDNVIIKYSNALEKTSGVIGDGVISMGKTAINGPIGEATKSMWNSAKG